MKILEIEILTNNLKECENFYNGILGLKIKYKDSKNISFLAGQSILTFIKSAELNPKYHFAFNIPCNKLEEAIDWTSENLELLENPDGGIVAHFDNWNAKAIYFYDNNGNIVEFIARYNLHNESNNRFESSSILSISEIGIVTDFPLKKADELIKKYNLSYFDKGFKTDMFTTLGDDNGLFIIVQTKRNWYPTNLKAEKFFTKIRLQENGEITIITLND